MEHAHKPAKKPELSFTYHEKVAIGKVAAANYHRMKPICDGVSPPKKQFDGLQRLYPDEPIWRCQEWTNEAVDALVAAACWSSALLTIERRSY